MTEELESVWQSISELAESFSDEDWKTVTECPGWTVQDQVVHIIGIERTLLGDPTPEVDLPSDLPHVKNDVGAMNEAWIESRRGHSGAEVLAEFREVTAERLRRVSAMSDDELGAPTPSPVGEVPYRDFLAVRVFDSWIHEQDIRRALGRPGGWDTPGAALAFGRVINALPFVVGKKAGAPEGASVVFALEDGDPVTVTVTEGRGRVSGEVPESPTARLILDREALVALGSGRWEPDTARAAGRVRLEGDTDLGGEVLRQLNFLF